MYRVPKTAHFERLRTTIAKMAFNTERRGSSGKQRITREEDLQVQTDFSAKPLIKHTHTHTNTHTHTHTHTHAHTHTHTHTHTHILTNTHTRCCLVSISC